MVEIFCFVLYKNDKWVRGVVIFNVFIGIEFLGLEFEGGARVGIFFVLFLFK